MFGLGGMEILVILVVGVVVLGPERLPKVMRGFTKIMSEFRRVSTDLQRTINTELNIQELNERQQREKLEAKKKAQATAQKTAAKSGSKGKAASAKIDDAQKPKKKKKKPVAPDASTDRAKVSGKPAVENPSAQPDSHIASTPGNIQSLGDTPSTVSSPAVDTLQPQEATLNTAETNTGPQAAPLVKPDVDSSAANPAQPDDLKQDSNSAPKFPASEPEAAPGKPASTSNNNGSLS